MPFRAKVVKSEHPFYIQAMPRVSEEYLAQRRQQILDAAQRCFARKGFYEASMQDVFRESGLSAGAVYRYFKSKDELVQAIAAGAIGHLAAVMEDALAQDPVPGIDEIAGRLATAVEELSEDGPARVAVAAWAAALHDPAVAATVRSALGGFRALWIKAVRRLQESGRLAPDADVHVAGAAVFALLPGFLLQHLILGDMDAGTLQLGLRQLLRPELLSPDGAETPR
jgi:AcrR family transcriptional regulator